jgi:hypothetical protein
VVNTESGKALIDWAD